MPESPKINCKRSYRILTLVFMSNMRYTIVVDISWIKYPSKLNHTVPHHQSILYDMHAMASKRPPVTIKWAINPSQFTSRFTTLASPCHVHHPYHHHRYYFPSSASLLMNEISDGIIWGGCFGSSLRVSWGLKVKFTHLPRMRKALPGQLKCTFRQILKHLLHRHKEYFSSATDLWTRRS